MSYKIGIPFAFKLFASCSQLYSDWNSYPGGEYVHKLSEGGLSFFLWTHDSVLLLFYAPWCGHCKAMRGDYARAAATLARELPSATLAAIDCDAYPGVVEQFRVPTFPTIKHFRKGEYTGEFSGSRSEPGFVAFMYQAKN